MKLEFKRRRAESWRLNLFLFCLLISICSLSSCAVPNIENPECREAQEFLKKFYSLHFGEGLRPSAEGFEKRREFLTDELKRKLEGQNETATDYFTQTDDYPKAFRVGACEIINENKILVEVLLFWKTDTRTEQREIRVEVVKEKNKLLINQVQNK